MANEGEFPKVPGDIAYASEVNSFRTKYLLVDETSDLNNSTASSSTTKEFTPPLPTQKPDNVLIKILGTWETSASGSESNSPSGNISLKIESKEVGGSYSTDFDDVMGSVPGFFRQNTQSHHFEFLRALTSGEKANGITFKITVTITAVSFAAFSFTNRQIIFEGVQ